MKKEGLYLTFAVPKMWHASNPPLGYVLSSVKTLSTIFSCIVCIDLYALMPSVCGLSFISIKFLFCSVLWGTNLFKEM